MRVGVLGWGVEPGVTPQVALLWRHARQQQQQQQRTASKYEFRGKRFLDDLTHLSDGFFFLQMFQIYATYSSVTLLAAAIQHTTLGREIGIGILQASVSLQGGSQTEVHFFYPRSTSTLNSA